jgi:hypothetical protein
VTRFLTRAALADVQATGWVHLSSPGVTIGSDAAELDRLTEMSRATLDAAGVDGSDRVLVALTDDGVSAGSLLTRAAVALGASASSVSPRGRTRVIRALRSLPATTLVTTPCGALDLLARIFIEFGLQPEALGLRRILVGGEIASPGALQQLADEFDCDVRQLLLDPFTGAALAQGVDWFEGVDAEVAARAFLERDELAADGPGPHELVVRAGRDGSWLRTGALLSSASGPGALPQFAHTLGDHVLARGRWLSLPAIDAALAAIDGVAAWQLETSREGTLDRVAVVVALDRPTLVDDKMWAGRISEAVGSVVPVRVETRAVGVDDVSVSQPVIDHRAHHVGTDRDAVVKSFVAP